MTDRFFALTVVLEKDTRDDDADALIEAIKMLRGVSDVKPHITNPELWTAETRARWELIGKLRAVLFPGPDHE